MVETYNDHTASQEQLTFLDIVYPNLGNSGGYRSVAAIFLVLRAS